MLDLLRAAIESAPPTSTDALPVWVYVVASAIVSALVTILSGKIVVPTFSYNRERDRADRLEAEKVAEQTATTLRVEQIESRHRAEIDKRDQQITALQTRVIDEFTPMIVRAVDVIDEQRQSIDKLQRQRRSAS